MASMNPDHPRRRMIALLIGNDNYTDPSNRLRQSVNNVHDLNKLLKSLNFDVRVVTDVQCDRLSQAFKSLRADTKDDDLLFVYFSGHNYQVNGVDYLIGVDDASLDSESNVVTNAVSLQENLDLLTNNSQFYALVVVIDCCTMYNLGETRRSKELPKPRGMRRIKVPRNTIIQFACDTDQVSKNVQNNDRNTLYARTLLQHVNRELVEIRDMFKYIENDVWRQSNNQQRPVSVHKLSKESQVFFKYHAEKPALHVEDFLSATPLNPDEKNYFDECKEFYQLTKEPLISIADEVLAKDSVPENIILKLALDVNCHQLQLQAFLDAFCQKMNLPQECLTLRRIQTGSAILEADISDRSRSGGVKLKLKMIYQRFTAELREELAKMKIFFMFFGKSESLVKIQRYRSEIKMNPQYNRNYMKGYDYWESPALDGLDRGGNPYFCPVGWKRWSFYVTDDFYKKFKGWSICYHGTKFAHALAILLSGLKPAERAEHGKGIYTSPSINYAAHPRYAEVKYIHSSEHNRFFPKGCHVQFVLECRVHPNNIILNGPQTLDVKVQIDDNIDNRVIEWLINGQGKTLVDFNDPSASIVCSGIMVRVTDNHPALLPQSQWWFFAHLCDYRKCCALDNDVEKLRRLKERGEQCSILNL